MDISEVTDEYGASSNNSSFEDNDEPESFIDWWDKVDEEMRKIYGVDTMDTGIEADEIANCQEDGWSPKQVAEWIGEKYDLDRKDGY